MKRFITFLVLLTVVFSAASCKRMPDEDGEVALPAGSQQESAENSNSEEQQEQEQEQPSETTEDDSQPQEPRPDSAQPTEADPPPFLPIDSLIDSTCENVVDPNTDQKAARLIELYGEGTVVRDHNNYYSIIIDTVTTKDYGAPPEHKTPSPDGWTRKSIDEWEQSMNLAQDIVVRAKATGRTLQRVTHHVNDDSSVSLLDTVSYAEVCILESYYGKRRPNEYIWVSGNFGMTTTGDGFTFTDKSIYGTIHDGIEYVIHAKTQDSDTRYALDRLSTLRLDVEYLPFSDEAPGAEYSMYKKYIIDKDFAFDRELEIKRFHIYNHLQYYNATYDQHQGNPDKNYDHPDFAPTEWQLKLIDEQMEYYTD